MAKKPSVRLLKALFPQTRASCLMNENSPTARSLGSGCVLETRRGGLVASPESVRALQSRSLLSLAVPSASSQRMEFSENRTVGYSAEQIYNIVSNVEEYHRFVPWCKKSRVLKRSHDDLQAQLEIGFPPITECYVSEVTFIPNHQVRAVCTDGTLFRHLETLWRFSPNSVNPADSCTVYFYVAFEFKSLLHSQLAVLFFNEVLKQMVNAFEMQAARLYRHPQESNIKRRTA